MRKSNPTNGLLFKKSKIAKLNTSEMNKIIGGKGQSSVPCTKTKSDEPSIKP